MRHLLTALAPSLLLVACTGTASPDDSDLTCVAAAWPTTAPAAMTVHGHLATAVGGTAVTTALVEIHAVGNDILLGGVDIAAADGAYAVPVTTDGHAPLAYRKATAEGFLDAYAYDPFPMTEEPQDVLMATAADLDALYRSAGITRDPSRGTLLLVVDDCGGRTVAGATVTVPGAEKVVYLGDDTHIDLARTATSHDSAVFALNVPVGAVDSTIDAEGLVYRSWPVTSHANALTTSWRRP